MALASMALLSSLALLLASWTACRRSIGSSISLRIATVMVATILPPAWSLSERTLMGAMAASDSSGSSSWAARYLRMAPATIQIAASFTVAPGTAFLIFLTSSSGTLMASNTRWGDTEPLNRVRGIFLTLLRLPRDSWAAALAMPGTVF